jgi:DNA-binding LytR/AlgR family response regulator
MSPYLSCIEVTLGSKRCTACEFRMGTPSLIVEEESRAREVVHAIHSEVVREGSSPRMPTELDIETRNGRANADRLLVGERNHRFHFLEARAIDFMEVSGNYVTIHVGDERFLVRATLKHLSAKLSASDFIRIDRSYLVNLRRVEYVERLEGGQFVFVLRRGQRIVSSRERAGGISKLLRSAVR